MILTKTTELAIQCVAYLADQPDGTRANPQELAERIGESTTYLAKVLRMLAQTGTLRSHRGVSGGFELIRSPESITLLELVEACQGTIPGNYCREIGPQEHRTTCGYHQAMLELQEGVREILGRWTIAQVVGTRPPVAPECRLRILCGK